MRRLAAVALCALALAGCSTVSGWFGGTTAPKPAELTANPATFAVRQAWTARLGPVNLALRVAVSGTSVVAAASDGSVAAFDAATGRELWRGNVGGPVAAGVGTDGKVVAVVTQSNDLVALEGGRELWRQRLPSVAYTPPLVAGERVFVHTADRAVSAFDGQTGKRLWTQTRPGEALVLRHPGVMLAVGDTLVVGLSGRLAGLNPNTGASRWEQPIASPRGLNDVERLVDLVGPASRVGDSVCARAFQASVGCVDAVRGQLQWTKPSSGSDGLSGDGAQLYGTEQDGKVLAWNRTNGDKGWTSELLLHRGVTAPLLLGRSVVVGDAFGYLHLLSREDGKLLNRLPTDGSAIAAPPVLAGNTLVAVTRNGGVYGFVPD